MLLLFVQKECKEINVRTKVLRDLLWRKQKKVSWPEHHMCFINRCFNSNLRKWRMGGIDKVSRGCGLILLLFIFTQQKSGQGNIKTTFFSKFHSPMTNRLKKSKQFKAFDKLPFCEKKQCKQQGAIFEMDYKLLHKCMILFSTSQPGPRCCPGKFDELTSPIWTFFVKQSFFSSDLFGFWVGAPGVGLAGS